MRRKFDAALVALGRLDSVTALLPNAALLLYGFIRKEAVLSSQIEGTQSSLADLKRMGVDPGSRVNLGAFSRGQRRYLNFHRENVLRMARVIARPDRC